MLKISSLQNKNINKPIFCIGTAPHLDKLDLTLLRNKVTIGCNSLIEQSNKLKLDYCCFMYSSRLDSVAKCTKNIKNTKLVLASSLQSEYRAITKNADEHNICYIDTKFTSPGHTQFFSFDLQKNVYAGSVIAMAIQLAVWLGGNPIYIIGVDALFKSKKAYYNSAGIELNRSVELINRYTCNDLRKWLGRVLLKLKANGIELLNASGDESSLDVLPRIRYRAAIGSPHIAVTSKTFCQNKYLIEQLKRYFPNVKLNNKNSNLIGKKLIEFLKDADGVVLGTENYTAETINKLPLLKYVSKYGVGLDNIDHEAAQKHYVKIEYRKGVNSDSVAELTIALCIMLLRKIHNSMHGYSTNKWSKLPGRELSEITIGIIGYGYVGKVVTQKFNTLNTGRILIHDIMNIDVPLPAENVSEDYLLSESDVVTFHVSMKKENKKFINDKLIKKMKPGALIINTSRGEIVDENALVNAIESGKLSAAALDVFSDEPNINPRIQECNNIITTCHIAGSSNRAIMDMGWAAIEGLIKLFNKELY